jgi:hypothetical protein
MGTQYNGTMPPPIRRVQESTVALIDAISRATIEADLIVDPTEAQIEDTENIWRLAQKRLLSKLPPDSIRPEHGHWNWKAKREALSDVGRFYAIERDGMMQGLMFIRFDKQGRLEAQVGLPLVYVDYIESAPWNLPNLAPEPRFRGVGTAFVKIAIAESLAMDWKGRIGLHSLPQVESFYRRLGMVDCEADNDYYGLTYFEMLPEQAIVL